MSRIIPPGSTNQQITLRAFDALTKRPKTITAETSGLELWYRRNGGSLIIFPSLVELDALNAVHTDYGVYPISDGYFRVDPPDAAFAVGASSVTIGGSASDTIIIAADHPLQSLTMAGSIVVPASVAEDLTTEDVLTIVQGDTLRRSWDNLNLTDIDEIILTIKDETKRSDAQALLKASLTGGLLYLGQQAATQANLASLEIDGTSIRFYVSHEATIGITRGQRWAFDLKMRNGATGDITSVVSNGRCVVKPAVTIDFE